MIKPVEIKKKAGEAGVRDQQIEKDYILSWILQGVAQHEHLSKCIVFKGGTVLKKIYFEDYRFSEDLDFTLLNPEISNEQIFEWFRETFTYIREEANISLEIIRDNEHDDGGINFYISYVGPLGGQGSNKKVKVDIARAEKLVFPPVVKEVNPAYSDLKKYSLLCYPLEEILVEKMRCIMQRMQLRDYYDIWFLLEEHGMEIEFHAKEFSEKCTCKGLTSSDFPNRLAERLPQYKARWQKSMNEQIKDLPDFEQVDRELQRHFRKLKS